MAAQLQRLCSATWVDGWRAPDGLLHGRRGTLGTNRRDRWDKQGNKTPLPHLGAFAHENQIIVPGFKNKVVGVGLDDAGGQSELYLYVADSEQGFIQGTGKLYVFKTDVKSTAGTPLHSGNMVDGQRIPGYFVEVTDPADLSTPPAQRAANLQNKVDALGAMPFVRIEDGDYDKTRPAPGDLLRGRETRRAAVHRLEPTASASATWPVRSTACSSSATTPRALR
jgi:hypothetical protein